MNAMLLIIYVDIKNCVVTYNLFLKEEIEAARVLWSSMTKAEKDKLTRKSPQDPHSLNKS